MVWLGDKPDDEDEGSSSQDGVNRQVPGKSKDQRMPSGYQSTNLIEKICRRTSFCALFTLSTKPS